MKTITVLLKNGTRVFLKGKDWVASSSFISIADEGGKHVATFPVEAIFGVWVSDSQESLKLALTNEGNA